MRNFRIGLVVSVAVLLASALVINVQAAQTDVSKQQKFLNYVTLPSGTTHYTIAVVQGKMITEQSGIRVMVQPANGPMAQPPIVGSRQADLSIGNSLTVYWAYKGMVDFKEPNRFVRVLQSGNDLLFGIITHKGTGIKSVQDLKGKRFTYNYPTSAFLKRLGELEMQAYGLSPKDVTAMKAEFSTKALEYLADKRTDAVIDSIQGPKMQELATKVDTVILPFEASKIGPIRNEMPPARAAMTPAGLPKIPEGIPVIAIPNILWCHQDLDENMAYQIVKILVENQQKMVPSSQDFKYWTADRAVHMMGLPYHPGAIKYYKEKGLWTQEMEKQQQELLAKGK